MANFNILTINNENDGKSLEVFISEDDKIGFNLQDTPSIEFYFEFETKEDVEALVKELNRLKKQL